MSDDQDHAPGSGDAGTQRALDELRVALEQLASRMGAGFREDLAQIRAIASAVAERDITPEVHALRADVAALVGRDDPGVLGTDVAEVLTRVDALAARLDRFGVEQGSLVEQLQDNLADVASGEVVGALWDEVRGMRAQLDAVADAAATPLPEPAPAEPDPQLAALTDELAVLRTELADGLVVEPSDALTASLDALRAEVDGLRDAIGDLPVPVPAPAAEPVVVERDDEALVQRLGAIQIGIDELRARLDEGLVLADDAALAPATEAVDDPGLEALADQVAALRDFVASELDTLQQTVSARLDAAVDATAATVAAAASAPEPAPQPTAPTGFDAEAVEQLRAEIRTAGAIPDQVIDALREELKALRRRIAVKANERVLDDQQLALIADAVAARLAEDRDRA